MRNQSPLRGPRRRTTILIPTPIVYAGLLLGATMLCLVLILSLDVVLGTGVENNDKSSSTAAESTSPNGAANLAILAMDPASSQTRNLDTHAQGAAAAIPTLGPLVESGAEPVLEPTPEPPTPVLPSPTPLPTATPDPTPVPPTPTPAFSLAPLPEQVRLDGIRHMWQTWNNCGPATLAMNLSYFGSTLDQATIGAAIRTHAEDKNVNAQELVDYARNQGFAAQARVNGDDDLLRTFISQGIPVLVETWLEPDPNDGFGHYRLLTGYDDANQRWIAHDSYVAENLVSGGAETYAGIYLPYVETDRLWAVYNRTYILIYLPEQTELVNAILGEQADPTVMWNSALARAEAEIAAQQAGTLPQTPYAWFNKGSALYQLGRMAEAAEAFDQARAIGLPWRMLWYQFEPFAVYHAVGRYQDLVDLARTTLATTRSLEEVQYWYGMGLAALGDTTAARQAWEYALQMKPGMTEARTALDSLQ